LCVHVGVVGAVRVTEASYSQGDLLVCVDTARRSRIVIVLSFRTLSNITAGNERQIQAVIEANMIPKLIVVRRSALCAVLFHVTTVCARADVDTSRYRDQEGGLLGAVQRYQWRQSCTDSTPRRERALTAPCLCV
jgi:hypothetical protein